MPVEKTASANDEYLVFRFLQKAYLRPGSKPAQPECNMIDFVSLTKNTTLKRAFERQSI